MSEYKKKAIVITQEGKPILLCEVKEFTAEEFVKIKSECEKNKEFFEHLKIKEAKAKEERLNEIEKNIKFLKGVD